VGVPEALQEPMKLHREFEVIHKLGALLVHYEIWFINANAQNTLQGFNNNQYPFAT
jgi:hypothetical protein